MNANAMNAAAHEDGALREIAFRLVRLPEDRQRIFLKQIREHGIDLQQLPIVAGPRPARVPLSHAQQQQWLLWKMRPDSAAYHLALPMRLRGDVDSVALQQTFDAIVARHESLRTHFGAEPGDRVVEVPLPRLSLERPAAVRAWTFKPVGVSSKGESFYNHFIQGSHSATLLDAE